MRRDYFSLSTRTPGESEDAVPTVVIGFAGPADQLRDALTDDADEPLPAGAIDVTCRIQGDGSETDCVVGLTHRLTGEFLLEANADADDILDLVDAARDVADGEASYRVRIETEDGGSYVYDQETLLVYDEDGGLLRRHSLIPSGVEL